MEGFPSSEEYRDCAGRLVRFSMMCVRTPTGWSVTATEITAGSCGYRFEGFSPAHPATALYAVRAKIRRALAVRYLTDGDPPRNSRMRSPAGTSAMIRTLARSAW
jgi:hypothetical protein